MSCVFAKLHLMPDRQSLEVLLCCLLSVETYCFVIMIELLKQNPRSLEVTIGLDQSLMHKVPDYPFTASHKALVHTCWLDKQGHL